MSSDPAQACAAVNAELERQVAAIAATRRGLAWLCGEDEEDSGPVTCAASPGAPAELPGPYFPRPVRKATSIESPLRRSSEEERSVVHLTDTGYEVVWESKGVPPADAAPYSLPVCNLVAPTSHAPSSLPQRTDAPSERVTLPQPPIAPSERVTHTQPTDAPSERVTLPLPTGQAGVDHLELTLSPGSCFESEKSVEPMLAPLPPPSP